MKLIKIAAVLLLAMLITLLAAACTDDNDDTSSTAPSSVTSRVPSDNASRTSSLPITSNDESGDRHTSFTSSDTVSGVSQTASR